MWSDTHKVDSTSVDEAEKEIFADSYGDLDAHNNVISENETRGELCLAG